MFCNSPALLTSMETSPSCNAVNFPRKAVASSAPIP
ncbi:hypothetical protein [Selenomonas sp.]